jgi:hypothetical protein
VLSSIVLVEDGGDLDNTEEAAMDNSTHRWSEIRAAYEKNRIGESEDKV